MVTGFILTAKITTAEVTVECGDFNKFDWPWCEVGAKLNEEKRDGLWQWDCVLPGQSIHCTHPYDAPACDYSTGHASCINGSVYDSNIEDNNIEWRCFIEYPNHPDTVTCSMPYTPDIPDTPDTPDTPDIPDTPNIPNPYIIPTIPPNPPKVVKIDGKCSAVHYGCEEGEPVDKKDNTETHKYEWVCKSENGGKDDICEELKSPENGVCGEERYECEVGTLDQTKSLLDKYTWVCEGLHGGETETCSIPKTINPDNECKGLCKLFENFGKTLKINYPFSDIKLKVDGGEVASSRAWAVCDTGLYWDSESETCLKPKVCPGEPDYQEPETPYWTYEYGEKCIIPDGTDKGELTVVGICQNYNEEEGMLCQKEDGQPHQSMTDEIKYECFLNPSQPSTIDVSLDAKRLDGVDIDEENPSTERQFKVSWNAVANPTHKFLRCEDIEVREPESSEIKYIDIDNESSSGVKEQRHPGTPGKLELSLTCYDKNGNEDTAEKTVYFDKITGSQTEY
jgi:hypothetical protein